MGNYVAEEIEEAIWTQDKFIVVVSKNALASQWVAREVEAALERERQEDINFIVPIRIDNALESTTSAWGAEFRRRRMVADFCNFIDPEYYRNALEQLAETISDHNIS